MRVMVYDATDTRPGPEMLDAWRLGSAVYRATRAVDSVFPAKSWTEAIMWLIGLGPVDEVQVWGHGGPGAAYIGKSVLVGDGLDTKLPGGSVHHAGVLRAVHVKRLFWLRTCASFAGRPGRRFATDLSRALRCRVAGHTYNIGPLQSGLHSVRPNEVPSWDEGEGWDAFGKIKSSTPWAPNTISMFHSSFPDRW